MKQTVQEDETIKIKHVININVALKPRSHICKAAGNMFQSIHHTILTIENSLKKMYVTIRMCSKLTEWVG